MLLQEEAASYRTIQVLRMWTSISIYLQELNIILQKESHLHSECFNVSIGGSVFDNHDEELLIFGLIFICTAAQESF